MYDSPLERRRPEEIAAAIERAAAYAREQDVPLTAERLAAELEMRLDTLHAIARGEYPPAVDKAHPSAGARRAAKNGTGYPSRLRRGDRQRGGACYAARLREQYAPAVSEKQCRL